MTKRILIFALILLILILIIVAGYNTERWIDEIIEEGYTGDGTAASTAAVERIRFWY